jgi:hypothetical protein
MLFWDRTKDACQKAWSLNRWKGMTRENKRKASIDESIQDSAETFPDSSELRKALDSEIRVFLFPEMWNDLWFPAIVILLPQRARKSQQIASICDLNPRALFFPSRVEVRPIDEHKQNGDTYAQISTDFGFRFRAFEETPLGNLEIAGRRFWISNAFLRGMIRLEASVGRAQNSFFRTTLQRAVLWISIISVYQKRSCGSCFQMPWGVSQLWHKYVIRRNGTLDFEIHRSYLFKGPTLKFRLCDNMGISPDSWYVQLSVSSSCHKDNPGAEARFISW